MSKNILVVGDSCIDVFRYGKVNRLAPEAPVPIIKPEYETSNSGMAGNVEANLKSLGATTNLITNNTKMKKVRYVCSKYNHLLLRVDENDACERINIVPFKTGIFDAVIISDYCKGFLEEEDIEIISKSFECPVFLDTKKILGEWANHVDFIKINYQEYLNNKQVLEDNPQLLEKTIVTRGKYGCDFRNQNYPTSDISVKDVSGAGDTFLAGLVYNYTYSKDIIKAIEFAQICTEKVITETGVSVV